MVSVAIGAFLYCVVITLYSEADMNYDVKLLLVN
jgi:hypothetical protein